MNFTRSYASVGTGRSRYLREQPANGERFATIAPMMKPTT